MLNLILIFGSVLIFMMRLPSLINGGYFEIAWLAELAFVTLMITIIERNQNKGTKK